MAGKNDGKIRCSFCGKTQDQVGRMISGPNGAFICDECVDICAEIIEEENLEEKAPASAKEEINLIKPEEMKAFLDDYVIGQDQAKRYFRLRYTIIIKECLQIRKMMWNFRKAIF